MAHWKDEFWNAGREIINKGGELRVNVTRRGQQRIIIIQKFPDNYIRCDEETVIQDD